MTHLKQITQSIYNKFDKKPFKTATNLQRSALPVEQTQEQEEKGTQYEIQEKTEDAAEQSETVNSREQTYTHDSHHRKFGQLCSKNGTANQKQVQFRIKQPVSIKVCPHCEDSIIPFTKEYNNLLIDINSLLHQKEELQKDIEKRQEKLDIVFSENLALKKQQKLKEEKRQKRKSSIPQSTRDTVTKHEFDEILKIIEQNNFVASRKKGAIILLYVTGLRISDLLKIKVQNMQELLEKGETFIDFTKKNCIKHAIRFSARSAKLVSQYTVNFSQLMIDKKEDSFLFTTVNTFNKPINRSSFDTEINNILIIAGYKFNKHIRSHSFRKTIIRDFLERTPVDVVQEIVGHKSINATMQYRCKKSKSLEVKSVLDKLDDERLNDETSDESIKQAIIETHKTEQEKVDIINRILFDAIK